MKYISKIFITIIIGLVLLICFKKDSNFKNNFIKKVYSENISFTKINDVYKKYLGSSMFFKDLVDSKPVFNEMNIINYEDYLDGIKVFDVNLITNLSEGIITFKGIKEGYGEVIIISDKNNNEVWYGNISNTSLNLYDYVNKGDLIGEVVDYLYLVIKQEDKIIKYEDYIK